MRRYAVINQRGDIQARFAALEDAFDKLQRETDSLFGLEGSQDVRGGRVHVWREQWRGAAKVEFVDDDELPARYLVIETPDEADAEQILAAVARHLPLETPEHLRDVARERAEEDPGALVRMALAEAETSDHEAVEIVRAHLRPEAPAPLRNAAVMAAALLRSPDLVGDLERLRDSVTDDTEQRVVNQAIRDCQEVQG